MKKSCFLTLAAVLLCMFIFSSASSSKDNSLEGSWYGSDDSASIFMQFSGPNLHLDFKGKDRKGMITSFILDGTYRINKKKIYMTVTKMTTIANGTEKTANSDDYPEELKVGSYSLHKNVLTYQLSDSKCYLVKFSPEKTELEGTWKRDSNNFEYIKFHGSHVTARFGKSEENNSTGGGTFHTNKNLLYMTFYWSVENCSETEQRVETTNIIDNGILNLNFSQTSEIKNKSIIKHFGQTTDVKIYTLEDNNLVLSNPFFDDMVYTKVSDD